jgi:hypothetical protein
VNTLRVLFVSPFQHFFDDINQGSQLCWSSRIWWLMLGSLAKLAKLFMCHMARLEGFNQRSWSIRLTRPAL